MPLNRTKGAVKLAVTNETELKQWADTPLKDTPYNPLLAVLAAAFDIAGKGDNAYVTLGTTKAGDSYTLTLTQGTDRQTVFAVSLADLSTEASDLLAPF